MRAIVRGVSESFENALASYFGNGPTNLDEAISACLAFIDNPEISVEEIGATTRWSVTTIQKNEKNSNKSSDYKTPEAKF